MREGKLRTAVDVSCGTMNHLRGQGTTGMNVDGEQCGRTASRFVKTDDGDVEVLTCGQHVERAKQRIAEHVE